MKPDEAELTYEEKRKCFYERMESGYFPYDRCTHQM